MDIARTFILLELEFNRKAGLRKSENQRHKLVGLARGAC